MEKYIEGVKNCKASVAWVVTKDKIEDIIKTIKFRFPNFTHKVSMDWDDDTLLWLRFTRESDSTQPIAIPKTVLTVPSATGTVPPPEKKKPQDQSQVRYGGPRW